MTREKIDNSGEGNCMYYAYGISLMYYLLKKRDVETAERIFNTLELSKSQKEQLHALLNDPKINRFSRAQRVDIIEPILGVATRKLASLQVKEELIKKPGSSSLLAAISYGMTYLFRLELEKNALLASEKNEEEYIRLQSLALLLEESNFDLPNFTEAEVYKVFNIKKPNSELYQHIVQHYQSIIDRYISEWPKHLEKIYQDKLQGVKRVVGESYLDRFKFIKELLDNKKLDFPLVIKKFQSEWEQVLEQAYEVSDKKLSKDEFASNPELRLKFLQKLVPKDKLQIKPAVKQFPLEWEAYVERVYQEQIIIKEEIKAEIKGNPLLQQLFLNNISALESLSFTNALEQFPLEWEAYVEGLYQEQIFTKEEIKQNDHYQRQFCKNITDKTTLNFAEVISTHEDTWAEWIEKSYEKKKTTVSKEELNEDPFYHSQFFISLIHETSLAFFTANDNANINKYVAHLNTDTRWGSEETLVLLHSSLQSPQEQHVDAKIQEISLAIYANGVPSSGSQRRRPNMILDNLGKWHWVSVLETGLAPKESINLKEEEHTPIETKSGKTANNLYSDYSLSLMDFLLQNGGLKTAERIFVRLGLPQEQKDKLYNLLKDKSLQGFSAQQIKEVIEPILGTAVKLIAGERTKELFLNDPKNSFAFKAINYGMIFLIKQILASQESPLAELLEDANFTDTAYTEDEIYLYFKKNLEKAAELEEFFFLNTPTIVEQFNQVFEFTEKSSGLITQEEAIEIKQNKRQFLLELITEKTREFFTKNSNEHVNSYVEHLQKNGDKKFLTILHNYLVENQDDLQLAIYKERNPSLVQSQVQFDLTFEQLNEDQSDLLLTPPSSVKLITDVSSVVDISPVSTQKTIEEKVAPIVEKKTTPTKAPSLSSKKIDSPIIPLETRIDQLIASGFSVYLEELKLKAEKFAKTYPDASSEADKLYKELDKVQTQYTAPNSNMTAENFIEKSQDLIKNAPKEHLQDHRGFGKILNGINNALIFIANLFIRAGNAFDNKFKLLEPNQIPTETIKQINSMEISLSALRMIRAREDLKALAIRETTSELVSPQAILIN